MINPYSSAVYYGNNDYRDYLAHHGVKGMKWGKHLFGRITGSYYKDKAADYNTQAKTYLHMGNQSGFAMASERAGKYSKKYYNSIGQRSVRAVKAAGGAVRDYAKQVIGTARQKLNRSLLYTVAKGKIRAGVKAIGRVLRRIGSGIKKRIQPLLPKKKTVQKAVG